MDWSHDAEAFNHFIFKRAVYWMLCSVNVIWFIILFSNSNWATQWNKIINHLFALSIKCDRVYKAIMELMVYTLLRPLDFLRENFGPHLLFGKLFCLLMHSLAGWLLRVLYSIVLLSQSVAFRAKQIDLKFTVLVEISNFQIEKECILLLSTTIQEWNRIQNINECSKQSVLLKYVCILSYKLKPKPSMKTKKKFNPISRKKSSSKADSLSGNIMDGPNVMLLRALASYFTNFNCILNCDKQKFKTFKSLRCDNLVDGVLFALLCLRSVP